MSIPFHKPYITKEDIKAVEKILSKGWLTMGPKTEEFEKAFKRYIGAKYAVAISSCTAGLHLALEAVGLREGDEVLVPAVTFTSTAEVVCYLGAKPVFVDIERDTHNIDISKIEARITKKTKAIIPVDYAGQPADLDEIKSIAKKYNLFVIEDAAHALPAWYKGKKVGNISDITCFSFYATKPLATGEGGMITTANKKWADRIKTMRLHGIDRNAWKRYSKKGKWFYRVVEAGFKYNLTDIQAALGLSQLKKIEFMWRKRRRIAHIYNEAFKNIEEIAIPYIKEDRETSWHLYVIKLNLNALRIDRNTFIKELDKKGVKVSVHFIPLYRHPFYIKKIGYKKKHFPKSEWVYKRIISLPIYPSMVKSEIFKVISIVKEVIKKNRR
jgi:perosamine synthetase